MLQRFSISNGSLGTSEDGKIFVLITPNFDERRSISSFYSVDEHFINSSLDPEEISRLEMEPEYTRMIFKVPKTCSMGEKFFFGVTSVGAVIDKDNLILMSDTEMPDLKLLSKLSSIKSVVLRLLTKSVVHFREHLKAVTTLSDELQNEINYSLENKQLIFMFGLQKSLLYYVDAIDHNKNLLERVKVNASKIGFSQEEEEELDYLIIENTQCSKQAEMHSNVLASLMDARASIVSNNLNNLMKTLNIMTIAIMVPTFVVSAFSMNVGIPFQDRSWAFFFIMGLAFLSTVGFILLWAFWHKKK